MVSQPNSAQIVSVLKLTAILSVVASLLLFYIIDTRALSATIEDYKKSGCDFKIKGEILTGDSNIILRTISSRFRMTEPYVDEIRPTVCLDSVGGSWEDGVSLAHAFLMNSVATRIEKDAECYSACAIIFMGGSTRSEDTHRPNRTLEIGGILGFHAPYLEIDESAKFSAQEAEQIYDYANRQFSRFIELFSFRSATYPRPWFATSLIHELNKYGRDEMMIIDEFQEIVRWDIELANYNKDEVSFLDIAQACINFQNWSSDKPSYEISPADLDQYIQSQNPDATGFYEVNTGGEYVIGCKFKLTEANRLLFCSYDEASEVNHGECPERPIDLPAIYTEKPTAKP